MKYLLTYTCIFLYLLASFKAITPFLAYSVNKVYIIKEFCVNKAKPEMHCDGKCYLKKKESEEKETEKLPVNQAKTEHSIAPHVATSEDENFREPVVICHSYVYDHYSILSFNSDIPTPPPKQLPANS